MSHWKAIADGVRHASGRLLLLPFATPAHRADTIDLGRVDRVLFVRPNFRMGNLLLTTPALTATRRALPESEIHLLATPRYADLLRGHPDLDRLVTFDRSMVARPWRLLGLIRELRSAGYDLAIDCSQAESLSGALLSRFSGARWRVSERSGRYASMFHVRVPRDPGRHHRVDRLLDVLRGIGITGGPVRMSIALDESEREWARTRWSREGLPNDRRVVGVNIGARGGKRWPIECFVRLVRRLEEERDIRVVVFAGPEDLDRLDGLEERLPDDAVVDTTHRVRRFAALLERCSVVVTGDTGPMHLAAAVGAPTVSIFLREDHPVFAPRGPRHRCLAGTAGVSPDDVLRATLESLDEPADAAGASIVRSP